jgi:hypothetical protein
MKVLFGLNGKEVAASLLFFWAKHIYISAPGFLTKSSAPTTLTSKVLPFVTTMAGCAGCIHSHQSVGGLHNSFVTAGPLKGCFLKHALANLCSRVRAGFKHTLVLLPVYKSPNIELMQVEDRFRK